MSLRRPTRDVEYSNNAIDWTSVKDDVVSFEIELCDLVEGIWSWQLTLDNKNGKYDSVFPAIPTEAGLHYFFRFKVNGVLLAIGRAVDIDPGFDEGGDLLEIRGDGLSRETMGLKCTVDDYRGWKADQIIGDQMGQAGDWYDLQAPSSPWTAPIYSKTITDSEKTPIRDLIAELAEAIDYVAYFKEDERPAPLQFFAKNDATKRLNVILKWGENIEGGRSPRSIDRIKNYLTLKDGKNFREDIPHGRDELTEDIGTYWVLISGEEVVKDTGDKIVGAASIKCWGAPDSPAMKLVLAQSGWGSNPLNPDNEGVDQFYFQWKNSEAAAAPRVCLIDDQSPARVIYQDFAASQIWAGKQFGVGGSWTGWSGDTAEFNGNIKEIMFSDETTYELGTPTVRVDNLHLFKSGGYDQAYLKDQNSIDKYGRQDEELALPSAFPYINMKKWGDGILQGFAKPLRTLDLSCLIDPAAVKEDDDVTAAKLYPGWSVQCKIPRWSIKLVADGGIWWRTLRTTYKWGKQGFTVGLKLVPTAAETEDYSHIKGSRLLHHENPLAAFINQLTRRKYV